MDKDEIAAINERNPVAHLMCCKNQSQRQLDIEQVARDIARNATLAYRHAHSDRLIANAEQGVAAQVMEALERCRVEGATRANEWPEVPND